MRGPTEGSGERTRLISEVSHALRNHFHRLYHWMEVAGAGALDPEGRQALGALEETVRAIERLTERTIDVLGPIELMLTRMTPAEILEGVCARLRQVAGGEITGQAAALPEAGAVVIDAGHFSEALERIGRRLTLGGTVGLPIRVAARVEGGRRLVVDIEVEGPMRDGTDEVDELVEWAHVERVLAHHGGAVTYDERTGRRVVVVLPLDLDRRA